MMWCCSGPARTMGSDGVIATISALDYSEIVPIKADRLVLESMLNFLPRLSMIDCSIKTGISNLKALCKLFWNMVDRRERTVYMTLPVTRFLLLGLDCLQTPCPVRSSHQHPTHGRPGAIGAPQACTGCGLSSEAAF